MVPTKWHHPPNLTIKEHVINDWGDVNALYDRGTIYLQKFDCIRNIDSDDGRTYPCLTVFCGNNIIGYLPPNEIGVERLTMADLHRMLRMKLPVQIMKVERDMNFIILSRRLAVERMSKQFWQAVDEREIEAGTVVEGTLITPAMPRKPLKIEVMGVTGEVPADEVYWEGWLYPKELQERYPIYSIVKAVVLEANVAEQKLVLSLKALQPDPWLNGIADKYKAGEVHTGLVVNKAEQGVFVRFSDGLVCWCGSSGEVSAGEEVLVKIRKVNKEKRRLNGIIVPVN